MNEAQIQLPRYKCHKQVWALKIAAIKRDNPDCDDDGSRTIVPANGDYANFKVGVEYMQKHKPEAGGYYIVYDDGYKSFSPAKAFEDGYTKA